MKFIKSKLKSSNLINHVYSPSRNKRSVLPFGGLFKFLFGTVDNNYLQDIKQDIQKLYDNQVDQANVLSDLISVVNVSRGLINENVMRINQIIETISFLNKTVDCLAEKLKPLYITRRFYLLHTEIQIHHFRVRTLIRQINKEIDLIKEYLTIHSTGKITPTIIDSTHLKQELLNIQEQLPTRLSLPENPSLNIWHYYRFLSVTPVTHDNSLLLMIIIPLIDLDSGMNIYKIYNCTHFSPRHTRIPQV